MTDAGLTADDFCYRHPDRRSYILCQRCGRTICPECQTPAPVGFQCPECMRQARQEAPRTRPAIVTRMRAGSGAPVVTYSLIAACVVVFLLQQIPGVNTLISIKPSPLFYLEPWTALTSIFAHTSAIHLLTNMFSLWIFGRALEPALGRVRFAVLYLLAGLGGSVGVVLFSGNPALGASGAIFGLFAGYFVYARSVGANARPIIALIVLNVVITFIQPGIAWQAHLGGAIVGALVALVFTRNDGPRRTGRRRLLTGAVAAGLAVLLALPLLAPTAFGVYLYLG